MSAKIVGPSMQGQWRILKWCSLPCPPPLSPTLSADKNVHKSENWRASEIRRQTCQNATNCVLNLKKFQGLILTLDYWRLCPQTIGKGGGGGGGGRGKGETRMKEKEGKEGKVPQNPLADSWNARPSDGWPTGWAKKTGPFCSSEILLRSARFFCRNQSRLILNTKT